MHFVIHHNVLTASVSVIKQSIKAHGPVVLKIESLLPWVPSSHQK